VNGAAEHGAQIYGNNIGNETGPGVRLAQTRVGKPGRGRGSYSAPLAPSRGGASDGRLGARRARAAAVVSVSGPSVGRLPTTRMRRKQTAARPRPRFRTRP